MQWPNVIKSKRLSITTIRKKLDEKFIPNIIKDLQSDWQSLETTMEVNDSYQLFHSKLLN